MTTEAMTMIANAGLTVTNDRDWAWITGDTYQFREMLKELGCRWSRKRQAWYLKPGAEKVLDFKEEKQEQEFNQEFHTDTSEGYMGAVKYTGTKSRQHLWGAELSKAIRQDLRDNVTELKRSAINVSCDTYSGGQSVCVTLKMERDKYFKTLEEFVEGSLDDFGRMFDWLYFEDESGNVVCKHHDWLYSDEFQTRDQQLAVMRKVLEYRYKNRVIEHETYEVSKYHMEYESHFLTDAAMKVLERVLQIVGAYHRDDSNSMVDYFDTNFYYDVRIKMA